MQGLNGQNTTGNTGATGQQDALGQSAHSLRYDPEYILTGRQGC
jgi:hypothetical protein